MESNQLPAVDHVSHSPVLPTQISAVRWKQPQTPLRLSLITLFCLSILEEPDIAPILWRDRRHRRFFLFLKGVLVYALIHQWWTLWKSNPPEYPPCKGGDHPMQSQGPCRPPFYRVARSETSLCYTIPFKGTAPRELLCRTLHSYSTAGCEFSLTRYPQRLSSLLSGRAILPRKPRWSSHGDSNPDLQLEGLSS